jgi:hypothetical protein
MPSVLDLRNALTHREDCQIVSAEEFVGHLTSHSAFERCDDPQANLVGLKFSTTGRRLYVPAEELVRSQKSLSMSPGARS